ncbi:MAG: hypothetical protein WD689_03650 [Gaiellaceae bacterium]
MPRSDPCRHGRHGVVKLLGVDEVIRSIAWILARLAPVVALGWLLYTAWRRGRLGWAFAAVAVLLAVAWLLAAAAVQTHFHDADGFVDCWPHCGALQTAVSWTLFYGPIYLVLLAVLAAVLAAVDRRRRGTSLLP